MLKFMGTVPIVYRGSTYHIPLTIWMPPTYPFAQPNVYVTPTPDMGIKPRHQHVDAEGKCYLPALSQWHGSHSNLPAIVGELQGVFAVSPPVFAKPKDQPSVRPPSDPYNMNGGYGSAAISSPPSLPSPQSPSSVSSSSSSSSYSSDSRVRTQMTERIQGECRRVADELSGFTTTQSVLEEGAQEINVALAKMQEHRRQLNSAIEWTEKASRDIDTWLVDHEGKAQTEDSVPVDDIVVPTSAVGGQLLEAVATNKALEDAMYLLNKAMHSDDIPIDCETFTKEMRRLASAQYMELALIRKIHRTGI